MIQKPLHCGDVIGLELDQLYKVIGEDKAQMIGLIHLSRAVIMAVF